MREPQLLFPQHHSYDTVRVRRFLEFLLYCELAGAKDIEGAEGYHPFKLIDRVIS
jgi:hypothetical protein